MAKQMAKFYKMAKCIFHGQRTKKMAKFFEIGQSGNHAAEASCQIPCWLLFCWNFYSVTRVDCIALNYWGKHKRKTAIRGIN